MPAPDWRGFFSNPMTYELPEEDFQAAYQNLASSDENMAAFTPEDHQAFLGQMTESLRPRTRPELTPAEAEVAATMLPIAQGQVGEPEYNAIVNQQVANEMTPAIMFAQQQMQRMGIAPETTMPVLGELARGNITTVPETWMTLLPGLAAQADLFSETLPDDSRMWRAVKDKIDWAATEGVPQFTEIITQALESGAAGLLPEQTEQAVREVTDVRNVGDAVNWLSGAMQQAGASSMPIILSSLVPMVGPAAALSISNAFVTGEYQQDRYREAGKADEGAEAVVRNIPAGLLELLGSEAEAGALLKAGKEAAQLAARKAIGFLKTAGIESGTEGSQEALKIANLRDQRGESMNPMDFTADEWKQIVNAAAAGAVGGAGFATAGLATAPGEYTVSKNINRQIEEFKTALRPEERAQQGIIDYKPRGRLDEAEARTRATDVLDFLTPEEATQFVRSEQIDIPAVVERTGKTEEEVYGALTKAEERAQELMTPPRQLAQPSPESDEVVAAIGEGLEELAVEAERLGQAELAQARRDRKGQIQVVEPETLFERGIIGLARKLGGAPRVALFVQPQVKGEPIHSGVFVRPGLIAIDVSDNIAPKVVLGTMFHELSHNIERLNPDLYRGTMQALRESPLWEKSRADLEKVMPAEKIDDREVFAHIFEQKGVATNVMAALADYASVEKAAKDPGAVRAVLEWIAEKFRLVTGKLNLTTDLEGMNLQQMQRIGALRADPELRRNAAKATLELVDMLKAAPPVETQERSTGYGVQEEAQEVAPVEEVAPMTEKGGAAPSAPVQQRLFSRTFTQMRKEEGMSPRGLESVQTEVNRFYQVRDDLYEKLRKAGVPKKEAEERAAKGANEWVKKNMKILDPEDLDDEQTMLTRFAQGLGVTINWYTGGAKSLGGFFSSPGQIWVHAENTTDWTFRQIVAHELMHDFRRRYPSLWRKVVDHAIKTMPEEWENIKKDLAKNDVYKDLTGESLYNEALAHLVHFNANEFWAAVLKAGSAPKAPVAFDRFFKFIGEKIKKLSDPLFSWARSVGLLGLKTDLNTPAGELGKKIVGYLAQAEGRFEGEYQAFVPARHEKRVERYKEKYREAMVKGKETGLKSIDFVTRMTAEVHRGTKREAPEQRPLFSRRVGYPEPAQTPAQLRTWRQRLAKMATFGGVGKFWYELSSAAILQMAGGDLDMARKFARLVAVYSPQTGVIVNWHRALTAWQRYLAGYSKEDFLDAQLGNENNHKKAAGILYDDQAWDGEKTNSFFSNLFTLLDDEVPDRATIDLWMMRAMGFSGEAPTAKQYEMMEAEVKRVAKKLGIETHQAQAMIWVYAKTVWEDNEFAQSVLDEAARQDIVTHVEKRKKDGTIEKDKNGKAKMVPTPEYMALYQEMFQAELKRDLKGNVSKYPISEAAMATFATGMERKVAVISQEAIPGEFLFGLADAPMHVKVAFTLAVEQALIEEGYDVIQQEMGLGPIGDISRMLLGNSAWFDDGKLQVNPSRQIEIPAAAERGAESTFTWDAASKQQAMLYAVIRGALTGQSAVAGYRRFEQDPKVADRNMAELDIGGRLSYDQQGELVKRLGDILEGLGVVPWAIALYPTRNGVAFMNTRHTNMDNKAFHGVVRKVLDGLSFSGKMSTFGADAFYVTKEPGNVTDEDGKVKEPYYAEVLTGHEDLLKRVERRVAHKLARIYQEYAERGFGDAPEWAAALTGTEETLRRDAKKYPHFWHFSVSPEVDREGLLRERAGTGATGAEAARFRFDQETGELLPESAVIHLYTPTARAETAVVSKASFINKVIADLTLVPTDSLALADLSRKHDGSIEAVGKELISLGYDGIVDVDRGMVQVFRDIDVSELEPGHELTAKERRAWKGALRIEDIAEGETYQHIAVPKVQGELTHADVQHVAGVLTDDGTAIFPRGTNEKMLRQYFEEVKPTSVGFVAMKPRRPQFSRTIADQHVAPVGEEDVILDTEQGALYSSRSGPGWALPHMDVWTKFVKKVQDSFIQFKRLNDMLATEGILIGEGIDVRLQEELYHGKVQEATRRLDDEFIHPLLTALRDLASEREESYEMLLAKFDEYLHARHAPERNKYVKEVWYHRKLDILNTRKGKLQDKIRALDYEIQQATDPDVRDSAKGRKKFWELKLQQVEQKIVETINQPELGSGMTDVKAVQIMQQTRLDGLDKVFGRLAGQYVDPLLKRVLDQQLAEGMITQKEYDNVARYKYYVPLKGRGVEGDLEDVFTLYGRSGNTGFDIRGSELPFVVGREVGAEVNPILAQVIVDAMADVDRIERNRVAVALLELAEQNPNRDLWEINKEVKRRVYDKATNTVKEVQDWWARNEPNVIGAKRGGETYFITLKDRGLVEAMKGLGVENLWKWVRALRVIMRTLAQLYTTWSPEFILTNFSRDWQQAVVSATTDMGKEAALEVARAAPSAVRGILAANFPDTMGRFRNEYTDYYHEMKEAGGRIGFFGMRGIEDQQKAILAEMRSGAMATTMRGLRRTGDYISSLNEATENGIRLATYVVARKKGMSKSKAASLAKNVTVNFNRRGDIGGAIGAGYLFFNAGVQGVDRFFRSMATPGGKKMAAAYLTIGFLTSVWSRAAMGDDDDDRDLYDKISNFTKGRHWIIADPWNKGQFIQIPMPYGFGVWGQLGKELEHLLFSDQDRSEAAAEAAVRMLTGLTTHFSPVGETSFEGGFYAMARPIIPTLIEPWTDILANETYWGGNIYPAKAAWDRRSDSARVYPGRTMSQRLLIQGTKKLNELTGGSEYRSGVIDLNANSLSYLLDSYVGPTGKFIKRPADLIQKKIRGDDTLWNDWIILRRFLSETAPQYYVPGEFYDAVTDVQAAEDELGWMQKQGASMDDVSRWRERHGWKLTLVKDSRKVQKVIRDIRNSAKDDEEARKRVLEIQKGFVSRYLKAERP